MRTLTLYHGTRDINDLLTPGGWARRISGGSSHVDIYGIHLTRSRRVAEVFAGQDRGGGVVRVEVDVDRPIILSEEDVERKGITLIQVGDYWRRTDGSRLDLADGWVEDVLARDGDPSVEWLQRVHQDIVEGRMSPLNWRDVPIALLRDTYCDAVIWPSGEGFVGMQHGGEEEVTVFDPNRIRIIKVYPNK